MLEINEPVSTNFAEESHLQKFLFIFLPVGIKRSKGVLGQPEAPVPDRGSARIEGTLLVSAVSPGRRPGKAGRLDDTGVPLAWRIPPASVAAYGRQCD